MKRGRPRSSFAVPRLWYRLSEMNYRASHIGLLRLKNDNFKPSDRFPNGTMLSRRELEESCNVFAPRLVSENFASDIVELLNVGRTKRALPPLNVNDEIVECAARVQGLMAAGPTHRSEHADPIADLAIAAGFSEAVIRCAMDGVILPRKTCEAIVQAADSVNIPNLSLSVEDWDPRWGGALPKDRTLAEILRRLV